MLFFLRSTFNIFSNPRHQIHLCCINCDTTMISDKTICSVLLNLSFAFFFFFTLPLLSYSTCRINVSEKDINGWSAQTQEQRNETVQKMLSDAMSLSTNNCVVFPSIFQIREILFSVLWTFYQQRASCRMNPLTERVQNTDVYDLIEFLNKLTSN